MVGNFSPEDIAIDEIQEKITHCGYRDKDFFPAFFSKMDIFLSPNRPNKLYEGNFDGFPIGIDAGFCGAAMFLTDELNMNRYFTDHEDIVIVLPESKDIVDKISMYYNDTDRLYRLSKKSMELSQRLFSINHQITERLEVFNKIYKKEYGNKIL